jgi:Bacterial regulatory helix-turn-helix protein, lysR family
MENTPLRRHAESVELQESGAENLHLAQPSLTRQIKHLEAEIGVFRFGHGIMRKCN